MTDLSDGRLQIRVAIVEDHVMIRQLLVRLLAGQEDMDVVAAIGSIEEATSVVPEAKPDVALVDIMMPDGSGVEWARNLRHSDPGIKIVFLTGYDSDETALEAIAIGAEGYLVKGGSCEQLMDAIRTVSMGNHVFDGAIMSTMASRLLGGGIHSDGCPDTPLDKLSARQKEIVALAAEGLTAKEIAEKAFVTINTVKTHMRRIYQLLGVASRRELVCVLRQSAPSGVHNGRWSLPA